MKWGARHRAWQKLYDEGRDPPATFYELDPPQVWSWLQYIWDAFYVLGTERQIGMGLGPIPASKIRDYAAREIDLESGSEAADRFFDLICRMDDEYRDDHDKTAKPGRSAEIRPDDAAGIGLLFKKIETRKKHEKKRAARKRMK